MSEIWAIARRDLISVFTGPLMWLVLASWSALTNLIFWLTIYEIRGGSSDQPLCMMSLHSGIFLLMLLAPALTMNSFTLERSQGTLQLLLTSSVKDRNIILGKFAASLICLWSLVAATLIQVVILALFSDLPGPQIAIGYVGLLLSCSVFAGFGVWISLIADSAVTAYVISFAALAILVVMGAGTDDTTVGLIGQRIGLLRRVDGFFRGELRLGDLVYFLGMTVATLVLANSVLTGRRLHG